ncbi:P-loop containing nucleoside triphosphate hydrolase protein [Penicillium lividum]|nr:P-loop containing nucleoside triphosphate hydrolase protein [Penicillium lividum]
MGFTSEHYLDVPMNEGSLPQGQMQLFTLAQALLLRSSRGKVVLLDEATGNVDRETYKRVQQVVLEEFQEYTLIIDLRQLLMLIRFL